MARLQSGGSDRRGLRIGGGALAFPVVAVMGVGYIPPLLPMINKPGPNRSHALEWLIWIVISLTILCVAIAYTVRRVDDGRLTKDLVVSGDVPPFLLTNQFAAPVTLTNLLGKVWVADVIFTRCPIVCETMSRRMRELQDQFAGAEKLNFLSLTADPENDTPAVLRRYAEHHKSNPNRWFFVTGLKRNVYDLAVNGLKFVVLDQTESRQAPEDLFVHSTQFVLVDKRGRIRGYFEGTDDREREQLALAVKRLLRER